MIIKGKSCGGARRLGIHLTRLDTNERFDVKEIRGVVSDNLYAALREIEAVAAGAMTTKPFYHASINTRGDERLTDEQRAYAIDKLESALGLTGQPRVVVVHEKKDREHCHIVWSRIDLDRMAAHSDSHNFRKHEKVARALEKEFGLERVQGAHVERDGKPRPERTPSHREMLQAERTGVSPQQAKELMTSTWQTTNNGKEFQAALAEKGWILARGDRRDFVAIDPTGGVHSIARRIEGAKAAEVRERFADIDPRGLMNVAEAKQVQRERHGGHGREGGRDRQGAVAPRKAVRQSEHGRTGVRPKAAMATMSQLWHACHNGKTFRASLEQKSWVLARGDRGGFVAIDSAGGTHNLAHRIQGATGADIRQRFADIDPASLPSVAEARKLQQERQAERTQQAATRAAGQARPDAGHVRASVKPRERAAPVGGKAGAAASRLAGSVFSALMGEKPVPKQKESEASKRAKDAGTPSERRQELMRQLSREIPQETERDAEYERDRNERDRGRERSR
ncbi:MAG TPA: relaxase/mobilization nuclease domain-containing protein [Steroidobacteraceae bacterium]|nr:relaxase/mobilization nuclease domain-containing protein [Steroidobacteraceae bacterium]